MKSNIDINEREKYLKAFEKYKHILTTNQNQVFHLYYIEDLSLSEIANILATTRSNVYDTLNKARNNLKKFIDID
ncbi:sigma factor-like helix-turn-helix DNA-binding protein [Mesomycoplasma moatsii]|uniref:sigma factor-like helix-turn-helix DNA-binding protein n=1 Tax=Mesomycoplasma moatsii TaxID=171287 RepID=UPI0003B4E1C0